jgi:outer membrane autotransporter protein
VGAGSRLVGNVEVGSGASSAALSLRGTVVAEGDLMFHNHGSSLGIQLNGTGASRANVSGLALLDGTLVTTFAPGTSLVRSYDVIHADGGFENTRFAGFNDPPNFLESLTYGPNDVFVDLTAALGAGAVLPGNQQSVADALNGSFNAAGVLPRNFLELYGLTGSTLSNALALAAGEAATGAQESAFQSMNLFLDTMLDPFVVGRSESADAFAAALSPGAELPTHKNAPPAFEPRWTSWAAAFDGNDHIDGDPAGTGSHDLSANAFGVAAGLDYHLTRDMLVGVALGGGRTSWGLSQGLGGGAGDVFDLGVYGSRQFGAAYVSGALAFANQWLTTSRSGPFGETLPGRFASQTYGGRIEGGYRLSTQVGGLTPYAALQGMDFDAHPYSEQDCCGGGFGLAYAGRTASDIRSEFGARFDQVVAVQPEASLTLRARAAWIHDWVSDPRLGATFETLPGASFNVVGAIPAKNAALLSGVAEMRLTGRATIGARFDGKLASGAHAYAGTAVLKLSF